MGHPIPILLREPADALRRRIRRHEFQSPVQCFAYAIVSYNALSGRRSLAGIRCSSVELEQPDAGPTEPGGEIRHFAWNLSARFDDKYRGIVALDPSLRRT
jgi:hypothetical protein